MPSILSFGEAALKKDLDKSKEVSSVVDTQPLPSDPRQNPVVDLIDIERSSSPTPSEDDSFLETLHIAHKGISPILGLSLLYILMAFDVNWFILVILQVILQALFFSKSLLENPVGRRVLLFYSFSMMSAAIVSITFAYELFQESEFITRQIFLYFFFMFAFVGFIYLNIYNMSLVFAFGSDEKWLINGETEDAREGNH
ncbi:hypothetical protein B9Z55_028439 [Caenorhabditis nigoni]|uniref:Uncharacterized protein n=1 Tax=Caenorhabditis nigoni TaxID=1611254 RepID=A0A2G5SBK2_9PELO|nr:hypothetical protein B9Z55_028439 [Caenorhabditis nigoni]